ncbi:MULTISPECIES: hypothetical protein [unclassified Coleofasciculus]|uniref:hypothetical protein n=1 Tax=unclassified Coleofasciculus TaxID=2692782 RepID=UPI00187E6FCC|nr:MULTISPECIES: hypothetical protein [unclassified Coleofasciculus]MBE9130264.1 hypothetical protein [Coleofasciculus sp. LEGE 07081]MBE9152553.1 hypothetical protein [Coleofasciculus sp. LEGE 07092]
MTHNQVEALIDQILQLGDEHWKMALNILAHRLRTRAMAMQVIGNPEASQLFAAAKLLELATEADEVVSLGNLEEDFPDAPN